MDCKLDEAIRAKEIAEKKFTDGDITGAKELALKAEKLYHELEGIQQMIATLEVHISAEKKIGGEVDWYGILNVNPEADEETIKKQYKKMALLVHPDKNKFVGAEGAFKLILEASTLLSDKIKKAEYDRKMNNARASQQQQNNARDSQKQSNSRASHQQNGCPEANSFSNSTKTSNSEKKEERGGPPPPEDNDFFGFSGTHEQATGSDESPPTWTNCFHNLTKTSEPKAKTVTGRGLIKLVFSWSLKDVLNKDFYRDKVKEIPKTFLSTTQYMSSFNAPLMEETHADLFSGLAAVSRAPICEILYVQKSKDYNDPDDLFYDIRLRPSLKDEPPKEFDNDSRTHKPKKGDLTDAYEPEDGDLIALTDVRPKRIDDLNRPPRSYIIAFVQGSCGNSNVIPILSSRPIEFHSRDRLRNERRGTFFAVYLTNMTTNIRIWRALNYELEEGNLKVIEKVLEPHTAAGENCTCCSQGNTILQDVIRSSNLNESQATAVLSCTSTRDCSHENNVKLIWGPPGTGKTKTVGSLLLALLRMKCRTLTCASTNIAVLEILTRLLSLVTESLEHDTYGLGDIVLFGNAKRMKIEDRHQLLDVFLDYRVKILGECCSVWERCLQSMIGLLQNPEEQYKQYKLQFVSGKEKYSDEDSGSGEDVDGEGDDWERKNSENVKSEEKEEEEEETQFHDKNFSGKRNEQFSKKAFVQTIKNKKREKRNQDGRSGKKKNKEQLKREKEEDKDGCSSIKKNKGESVIRKKVFLRFEEFIKKKISYFGERLKFCIVNLYTHLPTSFIPLKVVKNMIKALGLLNYLGSLLNSITDDNEGLLEVFKELDLVQSRASRFISLRTAIKDCIEILKVLHLTFSVPKFPEDLYLVKKICLANACIIFCTASSSCKMHIEGMNPVQFLVIDEAAQLKECESAIPLQLSGLRRAILVGDSRQLPSMVKSKISENAQYGRSLFERLLSLGYKTLLLNVQYRMHPSISRFPNREFYDKQIIDGPNVKEPNYGKRFLHGNMYGSYSFINVTYGKEDFENSSSPKNMVEASVVLELLANLYKESMATKQKVSVGVISPYKSQVFSIQERVGKQFTSGGASNFSLNVRSVDGFQGSEEDVIIISTVRCNGKGSVGFLSSLQRANVALTRARYCLWILGNASTLLNSDSIWNKIVNDAKDRQCFYNADEDRRLAHAIAATLIDYNEYGISQTMDFLLFQKAIWKVCFSENFWISMRYNCLDSRKEVLSLLEKLSNGWRHPNKKKNFNVMDKICSQLLERYKVNSSLYLVWSVDILKERAYYVQVLKVWDILPFSGIPMLAKYVDRIWNYTSEMFDRCKFRRVEGNIEVPMRWPVDSESANNPNPYEADPVHDLSMPLASLSLRDDPETSGTRFRSEEDK